MSSYNIRSKVPSPRVGSEFLESLESYTETWKSRRKGQLS